MRSVRLDDELESRLQLLSRETGEPVSEIIRRAVKAHCAALLGGENEKRLSYAIGSMASTRQSRRRTPLSDSHKAFGSAIRRGAARRTKKGR